MDNNHYWNIISLGFSNDSNALLQSHMQHNEIFDYYKSKSKISAPKSINEYREIDRHMSLEGDMCNSLECRAPFLNKVLWEFANSLPEDYLLNGYNKNDILKDAFKHEFPEGLLEKSKKGFVVPVGDWLRSGLKE